MSRPLTMTAERLRAERAAHDSNIQGLRTIEAVLDQIDSLEAVDESQLIQQIENLSVRAVDLIRHLQKQVAAHDRQFRHIPKGNHTRSQ